MSKENKPEESKQWYAVWGHADGKKATKLVYSPDNAFCLKQLAVAQDSGKYDFVSLERDNPPSPLDYTPGNSEYNRND